MRRIEVWAPIPGDPQDLVQLLSRSPAGWLPGPADERGPGHWGIDLRAGPIERRATCGVGQPMGDDANVRLRIVWRPDPEPGGELDTALPSFDGALELRAHGDHRAEIRLLGGYAPPVGSIGASLGPAQVRALAEATAVGFLEAVGHRLSGDEDVAAEVEPELDDDVEDQGAAS